MKATESGGSFILRRTVKRQWKRAVLGALFLGLWQLSEALVPIAIGLIIDHAVLPRDLRLLVISLVSFGALFFVLSGSYRIGSRALNRAVNHESHALRVEVASHALTKMSTKDLVPGEVMSRSTADADSITRIFGQLGTGVSALAGFAGAAIFLLFSDWLVGLIVLIIAPIISGIVAVSSRGISQRSSTQQATLATAGAQVGDTMLGLRVIKAIGGERWASSAYRQASQESAKAAINTAAATGKVAGIGELAVAINLAAVLLMAAWRVSSGQLEPGQLIAIIGIGVYLSEPIRLLSNSINAAAVAHGAANRVAEFLSVEEDKETNPENLDVSGSTFIVANPDCLTLPEQHEGALIVPHAADVFEGTIRSNIAMNHDPAAVVDDSVLAASGATDIVAALPDGLDAQVRDSGSNLSGGQRQRIALARALHADPDVLVLVDPTSAVDSVTEVNIAQGIRKYRAGKTTMVLSTSPAFRHIADRVIE
ncbi:ABC transporter transmembrane domain-containing protein [Corynebacterium casei]|uniref:ABC transporter transmembrane domain-containing protein n=2 Tax=Corynebacterium casei TaxID=160386 RepID=UPI000EEAAC59|nr:ABC transporter ATP-binding protein [Corynebacterium casei]MDN5798580.1 ABC transporter ATP-binding protein/permease [Corynebacterium casei]MDN5921239.1 ABC transporter ATP-binding protein/permease [Corynebacterium casei]MDN6285161.1 ABC transporter ATP-binding protein/permease [Corynebacterium casei]MDN6312847.1 ABC transporter ATP-binding protein/permease [Corynebacterium casei]MDN6341256.1 ABC transporter ATP-binding protein/permease [Corynebacterium casei]